jgi:hypothetical protein
MTASARKAACGLRAVLGTSLLIPHGIGSGGTESLDARPIHLRPLSEAEQTLAVQPRDRPGVKTGEVVGAVEGFVVDRHALNLLPSRLSEASLIRTTLRDWLLALIDDLCVDRRGCMLVNAATELSSSDPATQARAQAAFVATRDALEAVLDDARRRGELTTDLDPAASAELLLSIVIGLKVQCQAGAPRARLDRAVDAAMAGLAADARHAT